MNVFISGLTASGKSFQAKKLADKLGFKYFSASDVFLDLLKTKSKVGYDSNKHFWIKESNVKLIENIRDQNDLDVLVDNACLNYSNNISNVVIESRTLPWILENKDIIKIYLCASLNDRAVIAHGSKKEKTYSIKKLKEKINAKDLSDINRFNCLYNIDITNTDEFGLVLDNGKLSSEETHQLILNFVKKSL